MSWTALTYAFVLGMVATVNPCGLALLPVYLTALAGPGRSGAEGPLSRVPRAVLAGLAATAGFLALFAVVGALVSAGVRAIMAWVPELGIAAGVVLVAAGGLTAAGRHLGLRLPGAARRLGKGRGLSSMAGFGVSYAAASLGCTLPVFLAGVAGAFTRGGLGQGLGAFVAYALGMGAMLTALAVAHALVPAGRLGRVRAFGGKLERPIGVLLTLVGGYLVYYWGSDLAGWGGTSGVAGRVDRFDATLTSAIASAGPALGVALATVVLGAVVAVGARRHALRRVASRSSVMPGASAGPAARAAPCCAPSPSPEAAPTEGPGRAEQASGRARPSRSRWVWRLVPGALSAVIGAAVLLTRGVGVPSSGATGPVGDPGLVRLMNLDPLNAQSVATAPRFTLTDQWGRPLSLSSLRGRAVVLVFFDNHCRELCPLFSQDVRAAAADLGSLARRVAFVAVNVNPFYPQVRYDLAFDRRVGLDGVRDWYFLTGPLPALEAVWRAYGAQPLIGPDKSVDHTSVIDFIDPEGRIRDLGSYGPSSADSARWGYGLALMAEDLLGVHRPLAVRAPTAEPVTAPGRAPIFSLPAVDHSGKTTVSLGALRGRPVVLNFFATWCSACQSEAAGLGAEAKRLAGRAEFMGIDVDGGAAQAEGFVRRYGIGYPVGVDATGGVAAAYGVTGLPTTVFVSASGQEVAFHIGAISARELAAEVRQMTGGRRRAGSP